MELLSLNGKIVSADQAVLPATDPAVTYGYGLFEVTRAYRGLPFRLRDHLARLKRSARYFDLKFPYAPGWIGARVRELCRRNGLADAYVRVQITGGGALLIRTRPLERLPRAWYERGARVLLSDWKRDPDAPLFGHKTLNYLENIRTRERALKRGAADTIFVGLRDELLEGCVTNIFLVKRGRLHTPVVGHGILPGVTRKVILEIAARLRLGVDERTVYAGELYKCDEAFLTNALIEVLPVTHLGTRRICDVGPLTSRLRAEYSRAVEGEAPDRGEPIRQG